MVKTERFIYYSGEFKGMVEGYPVEEASTRYREPYSVQAHELQSVEDIKFCMENGLYKDRASIEESAYYLQSLIKKFTMLVAAEQSAGISNLMLQSKIAELKELCSQLIKQISPKQKIYNKVNQ